MLILGMGYANEEVQFIKANHRDICKYESTTDPNYVIIKESLVAAVANLLKDGGFFPSPHSQPLC